MNRTAVDHLRKCIVEKYGSVEKMAKANGMKKSPIQKMLCGKEVRPLYKIQVGHALNMNGLAYLKLLEVFELYPNYNLENQGK